MFICVVCISNIIIVSIAITSNNNVTNNGWSGIYLGSHNERVDILNNNISYNKKEGLRLLSFDDGLIDGNIINYNELGIWLWSGSDNNTIINNDINYHIYTSNYLSIF